MRTALSFFCKPGFELDRVRRSGGTSSLGGPQQSSAARARADVGPESMRRCAVRVAPLPFQVAVPGVCLSCGAVVTAGSQAIAGAHRGPTLQLCKPSLGDSPQNSEPRSCVRLYICGKQLPSREHSLT